MSMTNAQAIIINGQVFWEAEGSCSLNYSDGKMTGTRTFFCAWAERNTALIALVGRSIRLQDGLIRWVKFPDRFPGWEILTAQSVEVKGVGKITKDADEAPLYDYAKLIVTYQIQEYPEANDNDEAGQFAESETTAWHSEFITVPAGGVVWTPTGHESDNQPLLESTSFPVGIVDHRLIKRDLVVIPKATIAGVLNKTNDATYLGVAEGQLMFIGAEATKKTNAKGEKRYDVSYVLKERSIPWNYAWNPATGAFAKFQGAGTGVLVFPAADFTALDKGVA